MAIQAAKLQAAAGQLSEHANGQAGPGKLKAKPLAPEVKKAAEAWKEAKTAADELLKMLESEEKAIRKRSEDLGKELEKAQTKLSEDTVHHRGKSGEGDVGRDEALIKKLQDEKNGLDALIESIPKWEPRSKSWGETADKWKAAHTTLEGADGAATKRGDPPNTAPPTLAAANGGQGPARQALASPAPQTRSAASHPAREKSAARTGAAAVLSGAALAAILAAISEEKPSPPVPVSP